MFILLFAATQAIKLTSFDTFTINLNASASEYFVFQGPTDYSYFYQKNGQFQLWILQNDSHEIYQAPYMEKLVFSWPSNTINGEAMDLILHEGAIQRPLYFDFETYTTTINSIAAGDVEPISESLYKCKTFDDWIIYAGVFMVILIIALFRYKTLLRIFEYLISRGMQRFLTVQELDIDGESDYETMYNITEL